MDFVTSAINIIFKHSEETAKKVMLTHDEGSSQLEYISMR